MSANWRSRIGKHLWFDPKKPRTIVGVVGVVKQYGLETDGKIAAYFPLQQWPYRGTFLVARTSSDEAGLATAMIREIHAVDSSVVVYGVRTMQDRLFDSRAPALLHHHAGGIRSFRAAARGRGPVRSDVVSGDTEHPRYQDSGGAGGTA